MYNSIPLNLVFLSRYHPIPLQIILLLHPFQNYTLHDNKQETGHSYSQKASFKYISSETKIIYINILVGQDSAVETVGIGKQLPTFPHRVGSRVQTANLRG